MEDADRVLAGLCGRAWEAETVTERIVAVNAVLDWWDSRHVRWLDTLEERARERRLAFLAELDELDRDIQARIAALRAAA